MEDINKGMIKAKQSKNLVTSTVIVIDTHCEIREWNFHSRGAGMFHKECNFGAPGGSVG